MVQVCTQQPAVSGIALTMDLPALGDYNGLVFETENLQLDGRRKPCTVLQNALL